MIVLHVLNPWPLPWYDKRPTDAVVARVGVARVGATRLGYIEQWPPDDGPEDGEATWEEGIDSALPVSDRWTEGDDFK